MIIRIYTLAMLLFCCGFALKAQEVRLVVQHGHISHVNHVVVSHDGKLLASKDHKSIKIWEMRTGRLIQEIHEKSGSFDRIPFVFDHNNKAIIASKSSQLSSIEKWDIATGENEDVESMIGVVKEEKTTLIVYDHNPISANGRVIAKITANRPIKIKYLDDRKSPGPFKDTIGEYINAVSLSPDGKRVAVAENSNTLKVWDTKSNALLASLTFSRDKHMGRLHALAFSADGRRLLATTNYSRLYVWDIASKKKLIEYNIDPFYAEGKKSTLYASFHPNGQSVALLNHQLTFLALRTKRMSSPIKFAAHPNSIAFDPIGERFAVALGDKGIQVYNTNAKKLIWEVNNPTAPITAKTISKDHKYMAVVNSGVSLVKVWDLETGSLAKTIKSSNDAVHALSFSAVGHLLAAGGSNGQVDIIDVDRGQIIYTFKEHVKMVSAVQFHPTRPILVSGGKDQALFIWEAKTGNIIHRLIGHEKHKGEISRLVFSPDGEHLISGSSEVGDINGRSLKCWSVETGQAIHDFGKIKRDVYGIVFAPEGDKVLVARGTSLVQFHLSNGERIKKGGKWGTVPTREMALSPDGQTLATYSSNKNDEESIVKLLKYPELTRDGKDFPQHEKSIKTINFLKDGSYLLTSSNDHSLRFWDVKTRKEIMSLYMFEKGRAWVVIDSTGRFDANDTGKQYLHYVNGTDIIRLSQLMERYYEPGLMAKHLGQRPEPLRETEPLKEDDLGPIVDLSLNGNKLQIDLTPRSGGLGRVALYVNHKEIEEDLNPNRNTQFQLDLTEYARYFIPREPSLVGVVAFDRDDWLESDLAQVDYTLPPSAQGDGNTPGDIVLNTGKPRLFALCIGTSNYNDESFDLNFADNDAQKFADMLADAGKALFNAQSVEVKTLTTSKPTSEWPSKTNVRKAIEDFAQRTTAADVFVLYLSGHGNTSDKDGKDYFYYLTHDMSSGNLDDAHVRTNYAISTAEFTSWLNKIPAQKQAMMLDACASGKFNESAQDLLASRNIPASQVRALDRLRHRTGLFIISGSTADQVSYEASPFGQGLLTYSLLLGIQSGEALQDGQYIDVLNLFNYAKERVPNLAAQIGGIQEPMIMMPYGSESYAIGRATPDVRRRIQLAEEKPFFSRVRLSNDDTFDDDLGLETIVHEQMRDFASKGGNALFIFVDVQDDPNAYRIVGRYTVSGEDVSVQVRVMKGKESVGDGFEVSGKKSALGALGRQVIGRAYEVVE